MVEYFWGKQNCCKFKYVLRILFLMLVFSKWELWRYIIALIKDMNSCLDQENPIHRTDRWEESILRPQTGSHTFNDTPAQKLYQLLSVKQRYVYKKQAQKKYWSLGWNLNDSTTSLLPNNNIICCLCKNTVLNSAHWYTLSTWYSRVQF